jgi:hypothetical protein
MEDTIYYITHLDLILQISADIKSFFVALKPEVTGTIPIDKYWAGERARRVKLAKPAQL